MEETDNVFNIEEEVSPEIPKEKRKLETASYDYSVEYLVNLMNTKK